MRYKHYEGFRLSYRLDCNFWVTTRGYKDALWIAEAKHPDVRISIYAEAVRDGVSCKADVGIYFHQTIGKTYDEVMELFDQKIDAYIDSRVETGHWKQTYLDNGLAGKNSQQE